MTDRKNDIGPVKSKDQGSGEAGDRQENGEVYDVSLKLKREEESKEHKRQPVEEPQNLSAVETTHGDPLAAQRVRLCRLSYSEGRSACSRY